jgi:hypothetical protein
MFVSTSFSAFLSPAISAIRVSPGSKSEDLGVAGPCFGVFLGSFSQCVCVCSCLFCVYVFLCFIQVKALVVAFLAEFLSFVFRIVFASVIGRSKE